MIIRITQELAWEEPVPLHVFQVDPTLLASKNVQLGLLLSTSDDLYGDPSKYLRTFALIDQFRYNKTIDLSTRLVGITTEFVGFIPTSLVLRSIVLD